MSEQVRVYDSEPYQTELTARITACLPDGEGMLVLTDRTCFFPGGGGQDPDTGRIGGCTVAGVFEKDGLIWLKTAGVFREGEEVVLSVDPSKRRDDVEVHSGEHILSGTALRLFGVRNVGFHIGSDYATADFDRELAASEIEALEKETNRLIRLNQPVSIRYPAREELSSLALRKMPETEDAIRVVSIRDADLCACCGTHVKASGEIGLLRIFSSMRIRGGTRLFFLCGRKALDRSSEETRLLSEAAGSFSTSAEKLPAVIRKRLEEERESKTEIGRLEKELARFYAEKLLSGGSKHVETSLNCKPGMLREIAKRLCEEEGVSVYLNNGEFYVLAKHPLSKTDLNSLQEKLRSQGAAGGGRGDFYSGRLAEK
ncbi:MAG: alanyl-tRNA editing protein [Clostridia bacterium]|nr:alanyl-tRNA editing protein [Clostridia bacterium]